MKKEKRIPFTESAFTEIKSAQILLENYGFQNKEEVQELIRLLKEEKNVR